MRFLRAAGIGMWLMLAAIRCKHGTAEFTSIEVLQTYLAAHSGGTSVAAPIPLKLSGIALSTVDTADLFTPCLTPTNTSAST